jgi:isopentenyldiphosphate isomerase
LRPLSPDDLRRLREVRHELRFGWDLSQADVDRLEREWANLSAPGAHDAGETFALARADGSLTGAAGPRWLFHLLGLSHRASHVGLATQSRLIVVQRRAATKTDWPDAWDMAVAGHVPLGDDGSSLTFEAGAWKETEEEIGLPEAEAGDLLVEERLMPVGSPYFCFDRNLNRNPPFHNAEVRQLFAATLTSDGLARLHPDYEELSGLHLCTIEEAWCLLDAGNVASGLRHSLPRYLDWLIRR